MNTFIVSSLILCERVCVYMHTHVHACVVTCVWVNIVPEEGIKSPRVRATSGCKLPYVGAGKQTWVLFNNNRFS